MLSEETRFHMATLCEISQLSLQLWWYLRSVSSELVNIKKTVKIKLRLHGAILFLEISWPHELLQNIFFFFSYLNV